MQYHKLAIMAEVCWPAMRMSITSVLREMKRDEMSLYNCVSPVGPRLNS
jgi:hypothetical protein